MRYQYAKFPLDTKYRENAWFNELSRYLADRYYAIEHRLLETFRYVDFDARNATTFSYEFSSLLRDIGSVFGSFMDKLLEKTGTAPSGRQSNIVDYRAFLVKELPSLTELSIEIAINRTDNLIIPYSNFNIEKSKIEWWDAYNDLKHSDIQQFIQGNFKNVVNGIAAIAALMLLLDRDSTRYITMFQDLGFRNPEGQEPQDLIQQRLFFK